MNLNQDYDKNKAEFVKRLVVAGWTAEKADAEYERIQKDEDE